MTRYAYEYAVNASGVEVPIAGTGTLLADGYQTIGGFRVELANSVLSNATLTRNAAGDVSINVAAGANAIITFDIAGYFKEINSLLSTTSIPPVNANNQYIDSGKTPPSKGTMITDISVAYSIVGAGAPMTTHACRLDQNVFIAGANAITNIIANGANGLTTAATASATTCALTKVAIPVPAFDITDNDAVFFEINAVTPATCTYRLYEVFVHCSWNFN